MKFCFRTALTSLRAPPESRSPDSSSLFEVIEICVGLGNDTVTVRTEFSLGSVGEPINGDRIYNGAMDNGSGVALLLDMAASLQREKLRLSILFVIVTAEEKGLLGSKYFAARPTVAPKSNGG